MLSAIIATHESERALVPTLAALVPGATHGLLSEVIVADGGSRDATAEVADVAGCRFVASDAPLGARLRQAAATARMPWLLFLRAGCVPAPDWIAAVERFTEDAALHGAAQAAVFRRARSGGEIFSTPGTLFMRRPNPEQGLLIAKRHYDDIEGHPDGEDAENALLRRLGRRRIALLGAHMRAH